MKHLGLLLRKEWEKTLFWSCAAVFVLVLAAWIIGLVNSGEAKPLGGKSTRHYDSFLSQNALAFMAVPGKTAVDESNNPFAFDMAYEVQERKPWQRPQTPDNPTPEPNKPTPPRPKPPAPDPVPPTKPTPPPKPPVTRILKYNGMMQSATGVLLASFNVADPGTRKTTGGLKQSGQKTDGFEIVNFTEDQLVVRDSKGEEQTIPRGQSKKITIE